VEDRTFICPSQLIDQSDRPRSELLPLQRGPASGFCRGGDAPGAAGSNEMKTGRKDLWRGLNERARKALEGRDYKAGSFTERLVHSGVEAGELAAADRNKPATKRFWIPGVEIFARQVHLQAFRGSFAEFVRRDEGILAQIGLWPKQWSAARMFAHSAKGFHVHPPSIPPEADPERWIRRMFVVQPRNYSLRRYDDEQWDVMFFVQGRAEMILCDLRAGLPPRSMRFFVDGDNHCSCNNLGIIVPPGVAHAIRTEGSEDVIMVYGTSTNFHPEFEGRIASEVEAAPLPKSWRKFLRL
jgi:dTDP-4-dehydrorhamnose 3,5-epimerase-like enzyme